MKDKRMYYYKVNGADSVTGTIQKKDAKTHQTLNEASFTDFFNFCEKHGLELDGDAPRMFFDDLELLSPAEKSFKKTYERYLVDHPEKLTHTEKSFDDVKAFSPVYHLIITAMEQYLEDYKNSEI